MRTNPIAKQLTNLSMLYIYFNLDTQITEEVVQQWIVEEKMEKLNDCKHQTIPSLPVDVLLSDQNMK